LQETTAGNEGEERVSLAPVCCRQIGRRGACGDDLHRRRVLWQWKRVFNSEWERARHQYLSCRQPVLPLAPVSLIENVDPEAVPDPKVIPYAIASPGFQGLPAPWCDAWLPGLVMLSPNP